MTPAFWQGKRVFLTGHTGFKGSWLSLWLQSMGVDLTGYALIPPTKRNLFQQAGVVDGMKSVVGDVRDLNSLQKAMKVAQPEIVIHMAAQSLVRFSYQHPVETYATNVMGTVHLLESVRHTPSVRAVVNVTSDKCYENLNSNKNFQESDPMGGFDPYSNSKGCAELVSAAYTNSFFNSDAYSSHGVAVASARAGNVIGGGDWAMDRLIPDTLNAFQEGRTVAIRNPHAVRPWQHVLEALSGYLTLAEHLVEGGPNFSGGWNFGPHDADSQNVGWLVDQMAKLWGSGASWQIDNNKHPHEADYLKLDISKAHQKLGWQPVMKIQDALRLTIDWSKEDFLGEDLHVATLNQIKAYQKLRDLRA